MFIIYVFAAFQIVKYVKYYHNVQYEIYQTSQSRKTDQDFIVRNPVLYLRICCFSGSQVCLLLS